MSLLVATTSIRYRRYGETPWNSRYGMCMEYPKYSCYAAIKELIFKPYFEYLYDGFPEYIIKNTDYIDLRSRYKRRDVCWQTTSLQEVNDRIWIYK